MWRALYAMPINDPRALEATEEEVLQDLLIRYYQRQEADAANDPTGAKRDDMLDPDKLIRMAQQQNKWVKDPETQAKIRALRAMERGEKVTLKTEPTPPKPTRRKVRP